MLKSVLVANRGEIACRVIRTAQRLGLRTVAVYSDADAGARHVREADESVRIGASPATASYLDGDRIIAAAVATGVQAVHPGYGFLAESADFAERCIAAGLVFVGPSPASMRAIGDKASAKALARRVGVPVVPGSAEATDDAGLLTRAARQLGFPVMIKAVAGGGGRGMRLVGGVGEMGAAIDSARREAVAAFGDGRLLVERAIARPRHIEIQVFGDRHGNLVHLYERECSLQRRHQKLIEEAPAPGMSGGLRARLTSAAIELAGAAQYENAGTIEFLVEGGSLDVPDARLRQDVAAPFYFIEANPRLQVEHPVTEAITGLDLVEWQFRVASGEALPLRQADIAITGHAVEARICAEDPARGFLPDTGRILALDLSGDGAVRVESGVEAGTLVSEHYDNLLLKAIAHADSRSVALGQLADWLDASAILGVRTNMALLHALLTHDKVRAGNMDTSFVERETSAPSSEPAGPAPDFQRATAQGVELLIEAQAAKYHTSSSLLAPLGRPRLSSLPLAPLGRPRSLSPWDAADGFQLGSVRTLVRTILVDGAAVRVTLAWRGGRAVVVSTDVDGAAFAVARELPAVYDPVADRALVLDRWRQVVISWPVFGIDMGGGVREPGVTAPITGRVVRIGVAVGDSVQAGDMVAVVEAMKMEHVIVAAHAGRVARVLVTEGAQVAAGTVLAEITGQADEGAVPA
ncbi:MAG: biotin carboxylase N-terminal domain-containing protein [Hyphomicrobium sp.]